MTFMDKVKFWKKSDDDFSFDSSSAGSDPFATSADPSMSGLPPDPLAGGSSGNSFNDPLAPTPGGAFDDNSFGNSSGGDPFASQTPSSPQTFGNSNEPSFNSDASDPFSTSSSQDPFARPGTPPKPGDNSVGKSLAHKYIQNKQQSSSIPLNTPMHPQVVKPGADLEVVNLKLDAIRSEVNSMSQRLMRLETLIEEQNKKRGW
jgi:hypothetical protein